MKRLAMLCLILVIVLGPAAQARSAVLCYQTIDGELCLVKASTYNLDSVYYLVLKTKTGRQYVIVGDLAEYLKEKIENFDGKSVTLTGMGTESVLCQGKSVKVIYAKYINNIN